MKMNDPQYVVVSDPYYHNSKLEQKRGIIICIVGKCIHHPEVYPETPTVYLVQIGKRYYYLDDCELIFEDILG